MELKEGTDELFEGSGSAARSLEDHLSLPDEGYWNDNDLALAAELGKALLDRNRMLEQALEKARSAEKDRTLEVEHLCKELSDLKKSNLKQTTLAEETDQCNQDLDQSNRRLMAQIEVDKRTIRDLTNTVHQLEERLTDLSDQFEQTSNSSHVVSTPHIYLNGWTEQISTSTEVDPKELTNESTNDPITRSVNRPRASPYGQFIDDELLDQPNLGAHLTPEHHHDRSQQSDSLSFTLMPDVSSTAEPSFEEYVNSRPQSSCSYHSIGAKQNVHSLVVGRRSTSELHQNSCGINTPELLRLTSYGSMQPDDFDRLNELLEDAMLIKRMEAIYEEKLACNFQTLTSPDYLPRYKSLFQETFKILQDVKRQSGRSAPLPITTQLHPKM